MYKQYAHRVHTRHPLGKILLTINFTHKIDLSLNVQQFSGFQQLGIFDLQGSDR